MPTPFVLKFHDWFKRYVNVTLGLGEQWICKGLNLAWGGFVAKEPTVSNYVWQTIAVFISGTGSDTRLAPPQDGNPHTFCQKAANLLS